MSEKILKIPIINIHLKAPEKRRIEMFPNVIRCGIFGIFRPSEGGTMILMTILANIRLPENVYICATTLDQEKYKIFKLCNSKKLSDGRKLKIHSIRDASNLPDPNQVPVGSIIIFDDVLPEDTKKIAEFFLRGRHRDLSCFYLGQCYTKLSKKSAIRSNFNHLILLRMDETNLREIYKEYVHDLKFHDFKELCEVCWEKPYGFLVIDVENEKCHYKNQFVCY